MKQKWIVAGARKWNTDSISGPVSDVAKFLKELYDYALPSTPPSWLFTMLVPP